MRCPFGVGCILVWLPFIVFPVNMLLFDKFRQSPVLQSGRRNPVNVEINIRALVGIVDIVIPPDLRPFDVLAAPAGIGDGDCLLVF